jgi:hypothetical protein
MGSPAPLLARVQRFDDLRRMPRRLVGVCDDRGGFVGRVGLDRVRVVHFDRDLLAS